MVHTRDPAARRMETGRKPLALPGWAENSFMVEKPQNKQVRREARCTIFKRVYKERWGTDFSLFAGNNSALVVTSG